MKAQEFLNYAHDRFPGMTSRFFARDDLQDSYEDLCKLTMNIDWLRRDLVVLDLACGDGELTKKLQKNFEFETRFILVDQSEAELNLAKRRLGPARHNIDFKVGSAFSLPIQSNSVNLVVCHMALMLMRPVDRALAEISRVLVENGVFVAVIGGAWQESRIQEIFLRENRRVQNQYRVIEPEEFIDRRMRSTQAILELFSCVPLLNEVQVQDLTYERNFTPIQMTEFMMSVYDTYCLSDAGILDLQKSLFEEYRECCNSDGLIHFKINQKMIFSKKLTC
ncbi:MAG: class I SAM-dependent methyltransferase [Proteobacteria bacterium]|nr:class I SAM-dependent methyltransferase [Pseudomonadota bacterium]